MIESGILGNYECKLDDKNRICLPKMAKAQVEDGDELVVIVKEEFLEIKTSALILEELRAIKEKIKNTNDFETIEYLNNEYEQICFSVSKKVIVSQGRISLSDELVDKYSFENHVMVVGCDDCFRIYSPLVYNKKNSRGK